MRALDVCAQVVGTRQCVLFRPRGDGTAEYDVKDISEIGHNKRRKEGWILLDLFSASQILAVWQELNPDNKKKLEGMSLPRMADVSFKVSK